MRIYLLDPGLLNQHGHHFHIDLALFRESHLRGIPMTILAHQNVDEEIAEQLPVHAFFRASAYPSRDSEKERFLQADFDCFNLMVEQDLKQKFQFGLTSQDLIVVPTIRDIHLTGIYNWYAKLPDPKPKIFLRFLFSPWFRVKNEERELAIELSRSQLTLWKSLPSEQVVFSAESEALARYFRKLTDLAIAVTPMILDYREHGNNMRIPADSQNKHIVFLGEARQEKGFHLLFDAIKSVLQTYPKTRFTLQASCLFDVDQAYVYQLSNLSPNVSILTKALSTDAYNELLYSADVVLLAYDPVKYDLRTSMIFLEAAGIGKTVLTTTGTWMQEEMQALGLSGPFVQNFSAPAIADALILLLDNWEQYSNAAISAAAVTRQKHNVRHFMDEFLGIAKYENREKFAV